MIETAIEFTRYFCILLFGSVVAVDFAGMTPVRKNYLSFGALMVALFIIQLICLRSWGLDMTYKLYPLLSHIPVLIFTVVYLKRPWLISLISMFLSLLCCQPLRWVGTVIGDIFHSITMNHVGYIITAIFMYYFLKKYAVHSVQQLMERSVKSCLIFGAMPAFTYLFIYFTTVYTDYMYKGSRASVQFIPSIAFIFYFIFVIFYYDEIQKQARIERERDMLDTQLKQAQNELSSLRQMQQLAATYRHDMRHHFTLLQGLASNEQLDEIKEYLRTAQSDMDAITPMRFCENETVNLILSPYAARAKQLGVLLVIDAKLSTPLSISDTELCSLLSNALENAIHATENIPDNSKRYIKLRIYSKNSKLCIDIRNSYQTAPKFHQGLPISNNKGHGFGTKSMAHIVEKHGGVYQFSIQDGMFIFQATA